MKFLSKITILFFMITMAFAVVSCSTSTGSSSSKDKETEEPNGTTTPAPELPEEYKVPLTLKFIHDGEITITNPWSTLKYSKNGGELTSIEVSGDPVTATISVSKDDKISFFAEKSENLSSKYMNIGCSSDCYIFGNIMSLVTLNATSGEWDSTAKTLSTEYCFTQLFYNNTHLKNHKDKSLVLPAITLSDECYSSMFEDCRSLTKAPALPATTLADTCYGWMFKECFSLTDAPTLPATTLVDSCYYCMFFECTSLTVAPQLPATTLEPGCYYSMFYDCSSLTTAPELPAATLTDYCYSNMFKYCSNLNYIKCLATDLSAENCTEKWLEGVSPTGTFIKAADADWSGKTGDDGIPSGWTVEEAQ